MISIWVATWICMILQMLTIEFMRRRLDSHFEIIQNMIKRQDIQFEMIKNLHTYINSVANLITNINDVVEGDEWKHGGTDVQDD